jgi:hypothetical protein
MVMSNLHPRNGRGLPRMGDAKRGRERGRKQGGERRERRGRQSHQHDKTQSEKTSSSKKRLRQFTGHCPTVLQQMETFVLIFLFCKVCMAQEDFKSVHNVFPHRARLLLFPLLVFDGDRHPYFGGEKTQNKNILVCPHFEGRF